MNVTQAEHSTEAPVCQGAIFRDVEYLERTTWLDEGTLELAVITFPLAVVLTQDCDLAQHFTCKLRRAEPGKDDDKLLVSALTAPLYNAEHFWNGEHLSDMGLKYRSINVKKTEGDYIRQNSNPRYHYIEFPDEAKLPASVIDFKHYFAVPLDYLELIAGPQCAYQIGTLYRESLSQRFTAFLSRIALPANQPFPSLTASGIPL